MKHETKNTKIQNTRKAEVFYVPCSMFHERGFTLIELLTVTAIIIILSGLSLANYQARKKYDILILDTQKVAQMIRRAQNLALSPQYGVATIEGFGVNLTTSSSGGTVILFKDIGPGGDKRYSGASEKIEELKLDAQIRISSLNPSSPLDILYIPPDPLVSINNNGMVTSAIIRIELTTDATKYKTITATATGLVEVQ